MPSMADIVVKKADGTTNITFTALTPSSGDKVPSQWRSESAGTAPGLRPTFEMQTQWNGPRTARRVMLQGQYPFAVTDSTTTVTTVKARIPFQATYTLPVEIPDTVAAEAVAQISNLVNSALVQSAIKLGYAPT